MLQRVPSVVLLSLAGMYLPHDAVSQPIVVPPLAVFLVSSLILFLDKACESMVTFFNYVPLDKFLVFSGSRIANSSKWAKKNERSELMD